MLDNIHQIFYIGRINDLKPFRHRRIHYNFLSAQTQLGNVDFICAMEFLSVQWRFEIQITRSKVCKSG